MSFENLTVGRVTMHEIFKRTDKQPKAPVYAAELETLPAKALEEFHLRVSEALSAQSKSMQMRIIHVGDAHMVGIAEQLVACNDKDFLLKSRLVTDKLVEAQTARGVPGGVVVVFDGTVGVPAKPFVAAIKAEVQSGFRRLQRQQKTITEFLDDIFLTPAQRFYKIGFLVNEKPGAARSEAWQVHVFDSNITTSHRESAAQYFYESFLGCTFPENGPYETARFFDLTKDFLRKADVGPEKKRDLVDALFTFVKTDQAKTFTADEFAQNYLSLDLRDPFRKHMDANRFPTRAVVRDTSEMGTRLRRRKFRFGSDVELSTSPEALAEKRVTIKSGAAATMGGEGDAIWTQITIHQPMTDQQ